MRVIRAVHDESSSFKAVANVRVKSAMTKIALHAIHLRNPESKCTQLRPISFRMSHTPLKSDNVNVYHGIPASIIYSIPFSSTRTLVINEHKTELLRRFYNKFQY